MNFMFARRGLLATALALLLAPLSANATESASYTAFFQGKYLTALKLAQQEAAQGSKEAYTLMGEILRRGAWRRSGL